MKKHGKILSIVLVILMFLAGVGKVAKAFGIEKQVIRLNGKDRIITSIKVSSEAYTTADSVVLAGYISEVDALTGTLLASAIKGPLMLTYKNRIDPNLRQELNRLNVKNVYILGGTAAVNSFVESVLRESYNVKRISGANREATAVAVAKEVIGKKSHVFLAKGYGVLADALAIGPVSAIKDIPVLLTQKDKIGQTTKDALEEFKVKNITIVGGVAAVSKAVENELKDKGYKVDRISGPNREDTALAIAGKYFSGPKTAIVANGYKFADALVGGYFGKIKGAPILLSQADKISPNTINYIKSNSNKVYVLGGETAISTPVYDQIENALKESITSVSITGEPKQNTFIRANIVPAYAEAHYKWKTSDTIDGSYIDIPDSQDFHSYLLSARDVGKFIKAEVIAGGSYSGTVTSAAFGPIQTVDFAGGFGTKSDPYKVAVPDQLNNVRYYLDKHFIQIDDIDLKVDPYVKGEGWDPIGDFKDQFKGSYNGNEKNIIGPSINRNKGQYQGLFGCTAIGAKLSNVRLTSPSINGDSSVGPLVGYNIGSVDSCSAIRKSNIGNSHGSINIGGLVGTNDGVINKSYSSVNVNGSQSVGGLVGRNNNKITQSYAMGDVYGDQTEVGGLVGLSKDANIDNSYAIGTVLAKGDYVGGLVGKNDQAYIENCYSIGLVEGTGTSVGGLTGWSYEQTIINSFYNKETSKQNDTGKGIPKTTNEMQYDMTYENAGWDFDNIWAVDPQGYPGYPWLQWEHQ